MITILLYRLSFVQLGAALRKKTQPIEIYGLSGKIFLKTASKKVEFRDLIFSCVNASETERNGSKNCFKTHSVERTRGNGAFQYVYTRIVI